MSNSISTTYPFLVQVPTRISQRPGVFIDDDGDVERAAVRVLSVLTPLAALQPGFDLGRAGGQVEDDLGHAVVDEPLQGVVQQGAAGHQLQAVGQAGGQGVEGGGVGVRHHHARQDVLLLAGHRILEMLKVSPRRHNVFSVNRHYIHNKCKIWYGDVW